LFLERTEFPSFQSTHPPKDHEANSEVVEFALVGSRLHLANKLPPAPVMPEDNKKETPIIFHNPEVAYGRI